MSRRVVWVIGATSGIGLATARVLCAADDHVVLSSRSQSRCESVAGQIVGSTSSRAVDVCDADAVDATAAWIVGEHGRLDAVILTAQVMAYGRLEDVPREVYERVVDTATHGTANVARSVLPIFRRQGSGTLVLVNSLVGEIAVPKLSSYATAKWAQLGLARCLQLEVRDTPGVQVCIVSPGAVNTPIYDQAADYAGQRGYPPPPVLSPHRLANAVAGCLDRPRRHVEVGPANTITVLGFRLAPWLYDRIVGSLVDLIIFRGPHEPPTSGNALDPVASGENDQASWTLLGRRRRDSRPTSQHPKSELGDLS